MRFEDLTVWKRAAQLSAAIYRQLGHTREFGFKDQITRSALSISSNIAEGYERESPGDRVKFLWYAKSSCAELRSQIYVGIKADILSREIAKAWIKETNELSKMLHALIKSWRQR